MSELDTSHLSFGTHNHPSNGEYFHEDVYLDQQVFIDLAQRLGYQEDPLIKELREGFINTDYSQTEIPVKQAVAIFEQQCNIVARRHENAPDRLIVRRGLRLSEVAVYYHTGDYMACSEQLRIITHDVSLSSDEEKEHLPMLAQLHHHVQSRRFGQKTISIAS